jgi:hypothetical protein
VPDHWLPITLIAQQRGWSTAETAWAACRAGIGPALLGTHRLGLGVVERYGEVLSGGFIALVGLIFWVWQDL